jgi:hypothetical protein
MSRPRPMWLLRLDALRTASDVVGYWLYWRFVDVKLALFGLRRKNVKVLLDTILAQSRKADRLQAEVDRLKAELAAALPADSQIGKAIADFGSHH